MNKRVYGVIGISSIMANWNADEQISSLMLAVEETEKTEKEAARKWIDEHRELVDSWIPKEQ